MAVACVRVSTGSRSTTRSPKRFFFQAEDGIRDKLVTGVQTCALPIYCKTLSQLQDRVLHDTSVFPALLEYLTVQVSDMFRDPTYFRSLRTEVVPLLRTYPSLKVWVAGCSAGEEDRKSTRLNSSH